MQNQEVTLNDLKYLPRDIEKIILEYTLDILITGKQNTRKKRLNNEYNYRITLERLDLFVTGAGGRAARFTMVKIPIETHVGIIEKVIYVKNFNTDLSIGLFKADIMPLYAPQTMFEYNWLSVVNAALLQLESPLWQSGDSIGSIESGTCNILLSFLNVFGVNRKVLYSHPNFSRYR